MILSPAKTLAVRRRGVTLLETLIYVAVWTLLAVATMRALGDGRMLRAAGHDRAAMALIAQTELERIRSLPASALIEGVEKCTSKDWPKDVSLTVEIKNRGDGFYLVDVRVQRASVEGRRPVRLTTILPGGRRP